VLLWIASLTLAMTAVAKTIAAAKRNGQTPSIETTGNLKMISRRILATVAVLCMLIGPAHGQKTKAELNTEIGTSFPDSNPITPSNLRNVASDIVNSIMPTAPVASGNLSCFSGTTGLLQDCGRSITLNDVKLGPNSSTLPHPPVLGGSVFTGASATEANTFGNLISYGTGNLPELNLEMQHACSAKSFHEGVDIYRPVHVMLMPAAFISNATNDGKGPAA
jgi:hypothetical protein